MGTIYTFGVGTSLGKEIGFQVLLGIGVGMVVQLPVIVAGALSEMQDKAIALSVVCGEFFLADTPFAVQIWSPLHLLTAMCLQSPNSSLLPGSSLRQMPS